MRHILITGGSRGIGRAISLSQAQKGTTIFVNYLRDDDAALDVKKEIEKKGAKCELLQGNVGDPDSFKAMFEIVKKHTETLDAVIHSAALGVFKPVHQLRMKDWDISLDVNAKAFLILVQNALPFMKEKGGAVVTISSLGSGRYTPDYGAIGISKAALENLVRYLAVELASYKIRVNAVSGGLIDTDSLRMFPHFDQMKKEFLSRTPAGRLGTAEDIAKVVSFLLSNESAWIVGQTLVADGGYSLS